MIKGIERTWEIWEKQKDHILLVPILVNWGSGETTKVVLVLRGQKSGKIKSFIHQKISLVIELMDAYRHYRKSTGAVVAFSQ